MSDFWHKLGCCVLEKPQPKKRRRRIERSMIGEPMNFVHLTHIGSGDMAADRRCAGDEIQGWMGATVEQLPGLVAYSWVFQPKPQLPEPPSSPEAEASPASPCCN